MEALKQIQLLDGLELTPSANLPQTVKLEALALIEKVSSLLPAKQVDEIALFQKRRNLDPVIAVKVAGQWFSLFEWE